MTISVDWEGKTPKAGHLQAMRQFREDFPKIPLLHFLNPAHFTRPGAEATDLRREIGSVLRPGDMIGLHLHAWRDLIEAAGVDFRSSPSFIGAAGSQLIDGRYGYDVPIYVYTTEELRRLVRLGLHLLRENGFTAPIRVFRAGGWLADARVLDAIRAEGLTIDSSALPPEIGAHGFWSLPLYRSVRELWKDITPVSQPYIVETPSGALIEFPNNAGMADHVSADRAVKIFRDQANEAKRGQIVHFHYGFHDDTAQDMLPRVRAVLQKVKRYARLTGIRLEFVTMPTGCARILQSL